MDRGAWRATVHGIAPTIKSFQIIASTKTKKGEGLNPTRIQENPRFLPIVLLGSAGPLQPISRYFWPPSCPNPGVGHCGPLRKGKPLHQCWVCPRLLPAPGTQSCVSQQSAGSVLLTDFLQTSRSPQVWFLEAIFCRHRITLLPWETASPTPDPESKLLFPFPTAKPKGLYSNPSLAWSNHPSTHPEGWEATPLITRVPYTVPPGASPGPQRWLAFLMMIKGCTVEERRKIKASLILARHPAIFIYSTN